MVMVRAKLLHGVAAGARQDAGVVGCFCPRKDFSGTNNERGSGEADHPVEPARRSRSRTRHQRASARFTRPSLRCAA
jgi:hypothetical protein